MFFVPDTPDAFSLIEVTNMLPQESFPSNFQVVEVLGGAIANPHYVHPSGGIALAQNRLIIKISCDAETWYASFESWLPPTGLLTGFWTCPDPNCLLVVVSGDGYLVNVAKPAKVCEVNVVIPITTVIPVVEYNILLLTSFTNLAGIDESGVAWSSDRLGSDDLEVTDIRGKIVSGFVPTYPPGHGDPIPFQVDLTNGMKKGGLQPFV
jgi:hypothetical protein